MKVQFMVFSVAFLLFCVSCNNSTKSNYKNEELAEQEEVKKRAEQDALWKKQLAVGSAIYLKKFNFDQEYTIKSITDELYMLCKDYATFWDDPDGILKYSGVLDLTIKRLEFHLKNPKTFYNDLPNNNLLKIKKTPDGECKIYSFDQNSSGNWPDDITYFQYKDSFGNVTFCTYEHPSQPAGSCDDLWQFSSKGKNYYLIYMYYKYSEELMIFSIDNGEFTYHNEFFGDNQSEFAGTTATIPEYNIGFNPKTKIVSYTRREEKGEVKYSYKLVEK